MLARIGGGGSGGAINGNGQSPKIVPIIQLIVTVSLAILLPSTGWVVTKVLTLDNRLAVIEASRFTASDGATMRRELVEAIGALRRDIDRLPSTFPPDWFKAQVESIATQTKHNSDVLTQMQIDVAKLSK